MSAHPLHLERLEEAQREITAWFLAGGDAAVWLEELARWQGAQADLQLFPVPRASRDPRPAGLLVIPPEKATPLPGWRALALGVIEGPLYLPVDAVLSPPVTSAEVRALCRAEITLYHPGLGLVEFAASDRRGVWDLIAPAPIEVSNWNAARSAEPLSSRLAGVALPALPQGGEIFGDAEKEIGTDPPTELPRAPKEPSAGPMGRMARAAAGWGAAAVQKALSWLPKGSPPPAGKAGRGWIQQAMDWAAAKLAQVSSEMEELRHRELNRLMNMLESDPDQGLRHALPLGGSPGRGRAVPGARLGNRDLRFRTGGASAGGPVDPWDVPWEIRQKLMARYRELALREKQLGRFQRAAYIYAELLGDWNSAAAVLKEGRHFAEAGVVFRDRLQQPQAAAECFAAGGLFGEAIALYEKERLYLELGDLHRRLENETAAAEAYRNAIARKLGDGDILGAATLTEERLRLPDEALSLLGGAWPGAPQAAQCLAAQFALLGRLGRLDGARKRVAELRDESTPVRQIIPLAETLGQVWKTYPDTTLRPLAADVIRVKISGRLADGDAADARAGTRILSELAPEDRLLARDTSRFLAARLEALAPRTTPLMLPPPPRKAGSNRVGAPRSVFSFHLPKCARVLAVKRCGRNYVAIMQRDVAGESKSDTVILRGNWEGNRQETTWTTELARTAAASLVLQDGAGQPNHVLVLTLPRLIRRHHVLAANDAFPEPLSLGTPAWLPEELSAAAIGASHWWVLRGSSGEWIVDVRTDDGQLTGGFPLAHVLAEIDEPVHSVYMLAVRSQLWIAFGRHLFLFEAAGRAPRRWVCESTIIGLEPSAPLLASAVVARCMRGVAVFWCDHSGDHVEVLAPELERPFAVFLGNGALVAFSSVERPGGYQGEVIDVDRRGVHSRAEFFWQGDEPAGMVGAARQDQFAIFTRRGEVEVKRVPVEIV